MMRKNLYLVFASVLSLLVCLSNQAFASWVFSDLKDHYLYQTKKEMRILSRNRDLPSEFHRNFTLVYNSLSLQEADLTNPRIIRFSNNGRLILTNTGDNPLMEGYYATETAELSIPLARIYFREIISVNDWLDSLIAKIKALNKRSSKNKLQAEEYSNLLKKYQNGTPAVPDDKFFSNFNLTKDDIENLGTTERPELVKNGLFITKPNPSKCMACHALNTRELDIHLTKAHHLREARYIWKPYNIWKGVYGSNDDTLGKKVLHKNNLTSEIEQLIKLKYRSSFDKKSRYNRLSWGKHLYSPYLKFKLGGLNLEDVNYIDVDKMLLLTAEERNYAKSFNSEDATTKDLDMNFQDTPEVRKISNNYSNQYMRINSDLTSILNVNFGYVTSRLAVQNNKISKEISKAYCLDINDLRAGKTSYDFWGTEEIKWSKIRIPLENMSNPVGHNPDNLIYLMKPWDKESSSFDHSVGYDDGTVTTGYITRRFAIARLLGYSPDIFFNGTFDYADKTKSYKDTILYKSALKRFGYSFYSPSQQIFHKNNGPEFCERKGL